MSVTSAGRDDLFDDIREISRCSSIATTIAPGSILRSATKLRRKFEHADLLCGVVAPLVRHADVAVDHRQPFLLPESLVRFLRDPPGGHE